MAENEDKSLKVEGLGEKTVPEVEGLKKEGKIDVTATPTVSEPAPVEKVDVTATPVTSAQAPAAKIDPTAMPTSSGAGNSGNADWMKYLKIGGIALGAIIVIIIIITLVGGKKVVCTEETELMGMKMSEENVFKFDGDGKVKSISTEVKYDYSGLTEDKPSEEELKKECESYTKKDDRIKCSTTKDTLTVSGTTSDEKDLEKYKEMTYDKFKEAVEKNDGKVSGYGTCKVK